MRPFVSVVVPVFNGAPRVGRAVDSILRQRYRDLELVVVDDGSTDGSWEVVSAISHPRLRVLRQVNRGRSAARNLGLSQSKGEWIAFLDCDDLVEEGWLEALTGHCGPNTGLVTCGVRRVPPEGAGTEERIEMPGPRGPLFNGITALFRPPGTFLVRRGILEAVGGYIEGLEFSENSELGLRLSAEIARRGLRAKAVNRALVIYFERRFEDNLAPGQARSRYEAASYLLEAHGDRYLEHLPAGYANLAGIAGVSAFRLGKIPEGRRLLRRAFLENPRWKTAARWFISMAPGAARFVWGRDMKEEQESTSNMVRSPR